MRTEVKLSQIVPIYLASLGSSFAFLRIVRYRRLQFSHPTPFPCSIKPRSAKAEELIRSVIGDHPFQKGDSAILDKL